MKRKERLKLVVVNEHVNDPTEGYWNRRIRESVVRSVDDPDWEPMDLAPWDPDFYATMEGDR